jgi:hypothetical protein
MVKLSEQIIAELADAKSFERGLKYYKQGKVIYYEESDDEINATVLGTTEYEVVIELDDFITYCDCPYAEVTDYCKHVVAVLLTKVHGEINSTSKIKHKTANLESLSYKKIDFEKRLAAMSKELLIDRIKNISAWLPEIKKYFPYVPANPDPAFYKEAEKMIHREINNLGPDYYHGRYWDKQDETSFKISIFMQSLPHTEQTLIFLLKQGQWIFDELSRIDDSDAIIQDLIRNIILEIVQVVDSLGIDALSTIYEFISLDSTGDFALDVVYDLLTGSDTPQVVTNVADKLERLRFRRDPDFTFERKYGLKALLDYYRTKNDQRYEELALELIDSDTLALHDYIKYLDRNERYGEVLQYGWDLRENYDLSDVIEKALVKVADKKKLTKLYKERLSRRFDKDSFVKLKAQMSDSQDNGQWDKYVRSLIAKTDYLNDQIEILILHGCYEEVSKRLINSDNGGFLIDDFQVAQYASRFSVISPLIAIKLYRALMEYEIVKMSRSNHYKRFFEYWEALEELNDRDYLTHTKRQLTASWPKKKKLMEYLASK